MEELLPQDLDPLGLLADRIVQPALRIGLLFCGQSLAF